MIAKRVLCKPESGALPRILMDSEIQFTDVDGNVFCYREVGRLNRKNICFSFLIGMQFVQRTFRKKDAENGKVRESFSVLGAREFHGLTTDE